MAKAYQAALRNSGWTEVAKTIARCDELLRATIRVEPEKVAEIIEEAHSAIRQIKERRYAGALKGVGKEILLVGVSYDKDDANKRHSCVIEKVEGMG